MQFITLILLLTKTEIRLSYIDTSLPTSVFLLQICAIIIEYYHNNIRIIKTLRAIDMHSFIYELSL